MFNSKKLFIYRAITPLHCGGAEGGGVDLPVARERFTGFPIIPSSSLKGVWRDVCRNEWKKEDELVAFGPEPKSAEADKFDEEPEEGTEKKDAWRRHYAGCLAFTDAYPLFLPVRSNTDVFLLITCPFQIQRFNETCSLVGIPSPLAGAVDVQPGENQLIRLSSEGKKGKIYLEDLELDTEGKKMDITLTLPGHIKKRLTVVSDDTFKWFATNALEIRAHNQLNPKTKMSENLWYEEMVPAEAIFFAPVFSAPPRVSGGSGNDGSKYIDALMDAYRKQQFFQIGGHETTGRGLMEITAYPVQKDKNLKSKTEVSMERQVAE